MSRLLIAAAPVSRLAITACSMSVSRQPQGMPTTASLSLHARTEAQKASMLFRTTRISMLRYGRVEPGHDGSHTHPRMIKTLDSE